MNRIDRLSAMLIMLQTKRVVRAMDFSERFEISLRTVYRDMKALCEAGVPVGAEAGVGYYLCEGYHLPPVMFTPEEAGAMVLASKLVDSFSDISVRKGFARATDKIRSVLPQGQKDFLEGMENQIHVLFNASNNEDGFSNNFTLSIQKALSQDCCISIDYFAASKNEISKRIVEPLGLYFYGFSWHLIAYCKLRNEFRDFRIDRLRKLELTDEKRLHAGDFSIEKYFDMQNVKGELILLSVYFEKAKSWVVNSSRHYFGFYEEQEKDGLTEMKFAVSDLEYMSNWLISMGTIVKDINHSGLKELIRQKVKLLQSHFCDKK